MNQEKQSKDSPSSEEAFKSLEKKIHQIYRELENRDTDSQFINLNSQNEPTHETHELTQNNKLKKKKKKASCQGSQTAQDTKRGTTKH